MREGGNFLKRNNGGVRSGCESFLNGCYQRAGLTLEVLGRKSRGSGIKRMEIMKDGRIRRKTREGKDVAERRGEVEGK